MRYLIATVLTWCLAQGATAQEVDLELVLLVDVSRSMTEAELELQRRGYAEALASEQVFKAVQSGLLQTIALSYVEWAGDQQIIVDWREIRSREDLLDFSQALSVRFDPGLRRTSISGALQFGAQMLEDNRFEGLRRVIDISGDGPNNMGPFVNRARDQVLAQGITINGLPLMTQDGPGQVWHLENLDFYYEACVIGGPGAFVIPVETWPDFADAVRRKLVLEIADLGALIPRAGPEIPVQLSARDPSDCQIGEKIWDEFVRNRQFVLP